MTDLDRLDAPSAMDVVVSLARETLAKHDELAAAGWAVAPIPLNDEVRELLRPAEDSIECPMCGGRGRLVNVTAAIEDAQAAGTVLIPLRASDD